MIASALALLGTLLAQGRGLVLEKPTGPQYYRAVAGALAVVLLLGIVFLINKRRLREEYASLWLVTGFGIMMLAIFNELLDGVASLLNITPPSTALFFFGLVFTILVCLEFSVRLSRQSEQIKNLSQKIAILEAEAEATASPPSGAPEPAGAPAGGDAEEAKDER